MEFTYALIVAEPLLLSATRPTLSIVSASGKSHSIGLSIYHCKKSSGLFCSHPGSLALFFRSSTTGCSTTAIAWVVAFRPCISGIRAQINGLKNHGHCLRVQAAVIAAPTYLFAPLIHSSRRHSSGPTRMLPAAMETTSVIGCVGLISTQSVLCGKYSRTSLSTSAARRPTTRGIAGVKADRMMWRTFGLLVGKPVYCAVLMSLESRKHHHLMAGRLGE